MEIEIVQVHHNDSGSSTDEAAVIAELERLGLEYEEAVEYQYQRYGGSSDLSQGEMSVIGVNTTHVDVDEGCYDIVTHGAQLGAHISKGDFNVPGKNNIVAVNGHSTVNGHSRHVISVNGHEKHNTGTPGNDATNSITQKHECEPNNNEVKHKPRLANGKPKPARKPNIKAIGPKPAVAARKPHLKCLALKKPCSECVDIKNTQVNSSPVKVGVSHDGTFLNVNNVTENIPNVSETVESQESTMGRRSDSSSITSSISETIEKDITDTTMDINSSNPELNNGSSIEDINTDNDVTYEDEAGNEADDEDKQSDVAMETDCKGPKPKRRVTQNWHKSHLRKTSKALQEQLEENPKGTLSKKQLAKLLQKGAGNIKNFTSEYLKVPHIGKFNTERIKQSGKDIRKSMTEPWQQLKNWVQSRDSQSEENMMSRQNFTYSDDSDGGWGSDEFDDDYVPPEGYEKPIPEVKASMAKSRPLPSLPGGTSSTLEVPPRSGPTGRGRRRDVPPPPDESQPSFPNSDNSLAPPIPTSRRPNGQVRGRSPVPPVPSPNNQRTPPAETPPPLPPGRTRFPPPTPETPRFKPPTPETPRFRPPPSPGRPGEGVTNRSLPQLPPSPAVFEEEVYEVPDDNTEDYEELPTDEPPMMPPRGGRPLPSLPAPGKWNPRPPAPDLMASPPSGVAPTKPQVTEADNGMHIGRETLINVKLRPTGGPKNKNLPVINNSVDTDRQPGFNTIKESFQLRPTIIPKRGSVESNQSSEESSGSGEFQGAPSPKLPQANFTTPPSQLPPRLPSPAQKSVPRSPSPTPAPPADPFLSFIWYFGDITRHEGDAKVQFTSDGTFLVRRSRKGGDTNPYTLVVWCENKVWNVHLRLRTDNTYAVGSARENEQTFATIPELIEYHKINSILLANERGGRRVGQTKLRSSPRK